MSGNGKTYGPAHPYPLSLRTELVWEAEYDE